MSNLEKLVPPLEKCKKIPKGSFADSALVWGHTGEGYEVTSREVWKLLEILFPAVPAPTLAEILAVLPEGMAAVTRRQSGGWCAIAPDHGFPEDDPNPTVAAMRLWINIQEASR